MRLVATFLAVLLLTLTVLAGQNCGRTASQVQTLATAVADPRPCRASAGTDGEPLSAASTSEARDTQPEVEHSDEALVTGPLAVSPTAQPQTRAAMPALASPWLGGLLRPPRTLNG